MNKYQIGRIKTINENNQKRLETLFDAVVAIAMTMMAIEIVIPNVQYFDLSALQSLFNEITVYLISYIVLASIWVLHAILYSSYTSLDRLRAIISNIILMFIVTIFPILTKLMSEYHSSPLVMFIYIGTYLLMEIIMLCMLLLRKKRNIEERKHQLENVKLILEMMPATQEQDDTKFRDIKNKLNLAEKYLYDKEISENLFEELILSLPQTIQDMYRQKQTQNDIDLHKAICFLLIGFATVAASVAVLIINPFLCYLVFLIGGVSSLISNIYYEKKKGGKSNGIKMR